MLNPYARARLVALSGSFWIVTPRRYISVVLFRDKYAGGPESGADELMGSTGEVLFGF